MLNKALSKLSESQREAIILHYFYGKSYIDIAEYLEITEASVANRIYYGKKKIKNIILETMIDYLGGYVMNKNEFTKKVMNDFKVSFAYINEMTFINCFASVYTYLNRNTFIDEYQCNVKDANDCTACNKCRDYMKNKQESYYFLFDTMCGNASIRPNFDNTIENIDNKPETIDFLMNFAGYEYDTLSEDFSRKVKESLDANKPVIARIKGDIKGNFGNYFRVIIGYDNDSFIIVKNNTIKNIPDRPVTCNDFSEVIVISNTTKPKYMLVDCLKRIKAVMENNLTIWDECIKKFNYFDENLHSVGIDEIKKRFDRISSMSYYNFNCHNL